MTVLLLAALVSFAPKAWQGGMLEKITSKLTFFENNYPQEKVFLHLDKPYYAAGDDVWFSAYLVNSSDHAPSPLSKVLYVELVNPEDLIAQRVVLNMQEGKGFGDFTLPDSIQAGLYRVRAYTSWMQNFHEDYFFHQNIQIWNPRESDLTPAANFSFKRQGSGDSVIVDLQLLTPKKTLAPPTAITYTVLQGAKRAASRKLNTSPTGKTKLRFYLPDAGDNQVAQLQLSIPQGQKTVKKKLVVPRSGSALDLQFFPEGGNLVSGFWNNIGFKTTNAQGLGEDVKGVVVDQSGAKVADLTSLKFGMGRIGFMPEKGKRYEAKIKGADGSETTYSLPPAQDKGIIMTVDNSKPDKVRVKCYTIGFADGAGKPTALHVVAQSRGTAFFGASSTTGRDVFQADIPKEKFPTGISQITLFDQAGEPLAERLVFVNQNKNLQITITPDKPTYKPREKVTLQVEVKDAAGSPVVGNFSMSVTDGQTVVPDANSATLISYLQLSSDLRGYIEQPDYYFSATQEEAQTALDNLMLTQGWRRFVWKDILQDKFQAMPAPLEQGLSVSGVVTQYNEKKPVKDAVVTMFDVANMKNILFGNTDAQGRFSIALPTLKDSSRVVLQARNPKGKSNLIVSLEDPAPALVKPQVPYGTVAASLSDQQWAYLRNNQEQMKVDQSMGKGVLLGEVVVKGRKDPYANKSIADRTTLHSPGDVSYSVRGDRFPPGLDIISALPGRTPGVQMKEGKLVLRGGVTQSFDFGGEGGASEGGSTEPMYLIDGVRADMGLAQTLDPTQVERIDVLMPGAPSAIYGGEGVNGVISIIMKVPGSFVAKTNARWQGVAIYRGPKFQTVREFYMPKYDKPSKEFTPDWRSTLYWNPVIKTNAEGKAQVAFYCADAKTTYRAVVQGLTSKGLLGKGVTAMQVR
ncbi:TonB-dependent receptor plug domain-containing protein [Rufibacter immobilis]|uniref:TonB-dependent receptor plug domain-containing protein n=1 Tax=Rufibacter immobilis TaxID=1348778 RepID=UPI0035EF8C59